MTELQKAMHDGSYFAQYEKLVYKLAWGLHRSYGMDVDDLVAEAYFHLVRNAENYDPEKSTLSTWTHATAWGHMSRFCYSQAQDIPTDFSAEENQYVPAKENWLKNFLYEISEEAAALVSVALEAPEELKKAVVWKAPARSRRYIESYMIDVLDWSKADVKRVFGELQTCLS